MSDRPASPKLFGVPIVGDIKVKITITKIETGEIATSVESYHDFRLADFMWSEGNYSCDCNRELFFARWRGEEEPAEHCCSEDRFNAEWEQVHEDQTE